MAPPGGVEIRDRRPGDLDEVVDLALQSSSWHAETFDHIRRPPTRDALLEALVDLEPTSTRCFRVAHDGQRVVGFLTATLRPPTTTGIEALDDTSVYVSDLTVARGARRRGVARALLADLHRWSEQHGCRIIQLSMAAGNEPARRLYEGLGYRATWTTFRRDAD